jgi:hypothetical protein
VTLKHEQLSSPGPKQEAPPSGEGVWQWRQQNQKPMASFPLSLFLKHWHDPSNVSVDDSGTSQQLID